uniref:Tyrosine-protein phosphatase domain-containing protein n=1 Tax=Parastrongyloides trichosuri TaxID=131310 RepID=A0A0N4Z582_PARTI
MDGAVLAYGNLNINGNCPYRSGQSTVEAFVNRDGILVPRRPTEKELFKDQLRYLFSVQSISESTAKIYPCAIYRTHFSTPNIFIEGHDYELIDDGVQHIHVITKPIESQFFKPLVKVDDMKYSDFYANEDVSITNVLYDNDKKLKMIEQSVTIDNKILVKDYGIYNISYFCDPCNKDNIPVTTYKIYFFGPQQDYELISTELHIYKHDELSFTPNCSFSSYSFGYLDMISYGDDVLYVSILNNYHVKGYKGFEVIGNEVYYIKEKNPNNILRCYYKTPTYYVVQEYNFTRIDPSKLYEKSLHNDHIFTIYEATPEDLGNISDLNEILSSASNELSLLKNHVFNMEIQTMMLTILFVFIFYAIVILLFLIYFNNKESIILWFKKKRLVRKYPNVYSWCIKLNNTEKWSTYCSVIYSKNYGSSKVLCNKKKLILKEGEEIDDRIEELYNDTLVLSQSKLKSKIYAHYIDVKLCDRCYILSDHPTSQQIPQYWEMLYKDNISVVVSFSYTPPGDDSLMWKNFWPHCDMIYDNISIFKNESRETFIGGVNEYSYYVTCGEKSLAKNVKIYHVYRWKEHMMPEETIMLINLYKLVSASADKNAVLIDSSYGCDSGMFIYTYFACILESMLKDKTLTDPMNVIREIKECRYGGDIGAIEYGFLQKALVDFFLTGNILMDMDVYANFSTNFSAYTRSINLRVSSVPSELRTFLSFANVLDKGIVRQMCLGLHKVEEHDKDSLKELCSRWFDVENDPKLREMNRYHDIPCYDKYAIYSGEWPDYVNDPSTYLNANEISYFVTKDVERKLILCQVSFVTYPINLIFLGTNKFNSL